MSLFRYPLGTEVWWLRSPLEEPWMILKQRHTTSASAVAIEYLIEATSDPNLVLWAQERDVWSREEVPGS